MFLDELRFAKPTDAVLQESLARCSALSQRWSLDDSSQGRLQGTDFHTNWWARVSGSTFVGKCSATCYSAAAPPPGAQQGFGGAHAPATPPRSGRERGAALGGGGLAATPLLHSELRNEPRQGCSYTGARQGGGCSVCPTKGSTS